MHFNVYQNKAHLWGTLPWYWYFLSAIPKTLSLTLVFIPIGIYYSLKMHRDLLIKAIPIFIFCSLYSILPHKELRFIFYCFPYLNLLAAYGIATLYKNRKKTLITWIFGILILIGSFVISLGFLYISHYNYPGGEAFTTLHKIEDKTSNVSVHIDVKSAMTGVSRFGERNKNWRYSKEENINNYNLLLSYTHLLTENKSIIDKGDFYILREVYGYKKMKIMPPKIEIEPEIYIMKKKVINKNHMNQS